MYLDDDPPDRRRPRNLGLPEEDANPASLKSSRTPAPARLQIRPAGGHGHHGLQTHESMAGNGDEVQPPRSPRGQVNPQADPRCRPAAPRSASWSTTSPKSPAKGVMIGPALAAPDPACQRAVSLIPPVRRVVGEHHSLSTSPCLTGGYSTTTSTVDEVVPTAIPSATGQVRSPVQPKERRKADIGTQLATRRSGRPAQTNMSMKQCERSGQAAGNARRQA